MSIISISNLQKKFGRKVVIKDLNLEVEKGEFLSMFGPNGAGKTTLLRIISTLSKPTSGNIIINGYNIHEDPIEARRSIGVLSHNPFLYDNLTLYENMMFYSRMYEIEIGDKQIKGLLDKVGLLHRMNDRVGQFSRGMKQRAAIARAVIHDPPILLLDEPYTGLDIKAWKMLSDLLANFHKKGRTIFLITHNLELGYEVGERMVVLTKGDINEYQRRDITTCETLRAEYKKLLEIKG